MENMLTRNFLSLISCFFLHLWSVALSQCPYAHTILDYIITDFSCPFKAGSDGEQPKSVIPNVWSPAANKVMQALLACSLSI